MHLSRQLNCRSLRCSWSIACRPCSNYIFILDLTPGFKGLGKDDFKTGWESFKFWDLVRLILETLRYSFKMTTTSLSPGPVSSWLQHDTKCVIWFIWHHDNNTVETLYNTVNFCWSIHKRHSIARPKGRGMGCLLWVQRATYCVDFSKLSSIKYLL